MKTQGWVAIALTTVTLSLAASSYTGKVAKSTNKKLKNLDPASCVLEPLEQSGIGDVKYSILSETDFQKVHGAEWVQLDGRDVSAINYGTYPVIEGTVASVIDNTLSDYDDETKLPDASGKFLRAKNTVVGQNQNPDTMKLGEFQNDAFQGHHHTMHQGSWIGTQGNGVSTFSNAGGPAGYHGIGDPKDDGVNGAPRTASETRTKNITVNVFVKVRRACIDGSVASELEAAKEAVNALKCGPVDLVTYPNGCFEMAEVTETDKHSKVTCLKTGLEEWEADTTKKFWSHNCLIQTVATGKRILVSLGASKTPDELTWFDDIVAQYPYYNDVSWNALNQ